MDKAIFELLSLDRHWGAVIDANCRRLVSFCKALLRIDLKRPAGRGACPSALMIAANDHCRGQSLPCVAPRCLPLNHDVIFGMSGHHLILGKLTDFLTGEVLDDTLDERYRQKIARWLVVQSGYEPGEIEPRRDLLLQADHRRAVIKIDFVVRVAGRVGMIIRFGPG
jgi:hypothetical protein